VMKFGMGVVQGEMTGAEMVASWRYQVDAEKAGDTRLSLGVNFTDSGDSYTVELRNSILEIKQQPLPKGMPAVSLTQEQLRAILGGEAVSAQGDTKVLAELITFLDREQTGFSMHVR
jgi:alkyl sulfatase BDS1-like metallo-beta-lactamase superfamily hydrolase